VLRGGSGTAPVTLGCRVGGIGGQEGPAVRGAKLGSDGAPRRGKRAMSQSRSTVGEMAPSWADRAAHYELLNRGQIRRMITNAETCSTENREEPQPKVFCQWRNRKRSQSDLPSFFGTLGLRPNVDSPKCGMARRLDLCSSEQTWLIIMTTRATAAFAAGLGWLVTAGRGDPRKAITSEQSWE
jgi:hypothetical protein